jgi:Tol biopolymer transport system component
VGITRIAATVSCLGAATLLLFVTAGCGSRASPPQLAWLTWTDETPSWSPDAREIVFASNRARPRSSIDHLYVMSADGADVRRLTWDDADAREPTFSPDGKWIVYTANALDAAGNYTGAGAIDAISADGRLVRFLSQGLHGDADLPTWSPDGRWIAFTVNFESNTDPIGHEDLFVVRPDGIGLRRLATNVDGWALAWSPSSKAIAFSGNGHLYRVRVDAASPIHVPYFPPPDVPYLITDIDWLPDGSHIAFVRGTYAGNGDWDNRHVWILDMQSHRRRRLRSLTGSDNLGSFNVSMTCIRGRKATCAIDEGQHIELVSVDGRNRRPIKGISWAGLSAGSASPDGRKLLLVVPGPGHTSAIFAANVNRQRTDQLSQRP